MPVGAFMGLAAFVCFSLFLGARLFALARRGGGAPEYALAVAFVFSGGIGAGFQAVVPLGLGSPAFQDASFGVVRFGMAVGIACQMIFTWRVFRPDTRWGAAVVACGAAVMLAILAGYAHAGALGDQTYRGPWFWLEVPVLVAGLGWGAVESLVYWRRMRRRLSLGLADAVVTNRFLIWGIGLGAGVGALITPPLYYLRFGPAALDGLLAGITAGFGLVSVLAYALTFFPPAWWRRRLERRAQRF